MKRETARQDLVVVVLGETMTRGLERETATIRKGRVCSDGEEGPGPGVESEELVLVDNCFQPCHTTSGSHRHKTISQLLFLDSPPVLPQALSVCPPLLYLCEL